jgi:branched-chain amino acid transport system substrate-binding protein
MFEKISRMLLRGYPGVTVAATILLAVPMFANGAEPIKIGLGIAQSGQLAPAGKSALLGMKIWEDDINAGGGLLGRPVKLVFLDDQSNPSNVPGIYTKLLDVDKVDLVVSGYATNMIAPAMPIVIQKKKLLIGLFGTAVNSEFHYSNYFSMNTNGPDPKRAVTAGFFEVAAAQSPKPQTVAIVAADAEFGRNASEGAKENAKAAGLNVVYERTYPPSTTDFSPIVRAMQATKPDIVVVCSYPLDSVGILRTVKEVGFEPNMIGGAMVGLQSTAIKAQLGPILNGVVNYESWIPAKTLQFPGVDEFLRKYQARAVSEGVDPIGYNLPPWGYSVMQVLEQAIRGTNSLNDEVLSKYLKSNTVQTIVGPVTFGRDGEWAVSRMLQVQYRNIRGNDVSQFKDVEGQVILTPSRFKTGDVIYPMTKARN